MFEILNVINAIDKQKMATNKTIQASRLALMIKKEEKVVKTVINK